MEKRNGGPNLTTPTWNQNHLHNEIVWKVVTRNMIYHSLSTPSPRNISFLNYSVYFSSLQKIKKTKIPERSKHSGLRGTPKKHQNVIIYSIFKKNKCMGIYVKNTITYRTLAPEDFFFNSTLFSSLCLGHFASTKSNLYI